MGAEIGGVDLSRAYTAAERSELTELLLHHKVLFLRGQMLSSFDQVARVAELQEVSVSVLPNLGGDTLFVDTAAALADLSDERREVYRPLTADFHKEHTFPTGALPQRPQATGSPSVRWNTTRHHPSSNLS